MTSEFGHLFNFAAPIVPPPTSGDPSSYYNSLNLVVNATQCSNNGLEFLIYRNNGDQSLFDHYLMMDGLVHFIKEGDSFPLVIPCLYNVIASSNTLLILVNPSLNIELKKSLDPGVPVPTSILIENIDEVSFRNDLKLYIQNALNGIHPNLVGWSPFSPSTMLLLLNSYLGTGSIDDKIDNFIDKVVNTSNNKVGIFMPGSLKLGKFLNNSNNIAKTKIRILVSDISDINPDYVSPVHYLRQLVNLPDKIIGLKWTNHPLITSISEFDFAVDFYVKFEIWNPLSLIDPNNELEYISINDGCEVYLWDNNTISDEILTTGYTDASGSVHFHFNSKINDTAFLNSTTADIYFEIISPTSSKIDSYNINHSNKINLPQSWKSKPSSLNSDNWKSTNGTPGFIENFCGFRYGDESNPITFRIGVDYHLLLTYVNDRIKTNSNDGIKIYPKGIPCYVIDENASNLNLNSYDYKRTDENGIIHGITFKLKPNQDIGIAVRFEISDPIINLNNCFIDRNNFGSHYFWFSNVTDGDHHVIEKSKFLSSVGSNTKLEEFCCRTEDRNKSVYVLKIVYEWAYFFFHMTSGAWSSLNNIEINLNASGSMSFPKGHVLYGKYGNSINDDDAWDRSIIVHELSHTVMYQLIENIEFDVAIKTIWINLWNNMTGHKWNQISNQKFAFVEGWAEFMQVLFGYQETINNKLITYKPKLTSLIVESTSDINHITNHLSPLPFGTGNYIEGAVCNGLVAIFWKYIVGYNSSNDRIIFESENGNLSLNNTWILDQNVVKRFYTHIYNILANIKMVVNSDNYIFFNRMLNSFNDNKNYYKSELYKWNILDSLEDPKLPAISNLVPSSGNAIDDNQIITINGTDFIEIDDTKLVDDYELNISMMIIFNGIEYGRSKNNSIGYYYENNKLKFKAPKLNIQNNTSVLLQVKITISSFSMFSNEVSFLVLIN